MSHLHRERPGAIRGRAREERRDEMASKDKLAAVTEIKERITDSEGMILIT